MLTAIIVIWLLRILIKEGGRRRKKKGVPKASSAAVALGTSSDLAETAAGSSCPLCGSTLQAGQRVHSVVYPGETVRFVEIYGCPNCRPKGGPVRAVRRCPVCHEELGEQDYVVGRMSDRSPEHGVVRKHLHVLGCTRCRKHA